MSPIILLIISARATVRALLVRTLLIGSAWLLLAIVTHVWLLLVVVCTLWRVAAVLLILWGILLVVRGLGGRWALLRSVV